MARLMAPLMVHERAMPPASPTGGPDTPEAEALRPAAPRLRNSIHTRSKEDISL